MWWSLICLRDRYILWWRHQMETFSASLALCEGNPPVTRALMLSLICAWTNGRANNRDDSELRRHRAYYGVTVMRSSNNHIKVSAVHVPGLSYFAIKCQTIGLYVKLLNTKLLEISFLQLRSTYLDIRDRAFNCPAALLRYELIWSVKLRRLPIHLHF